MKILINGGCGFLGSNLAAEGIIKGHEVIVFDNLFRKGSAENLKYLQTLGNFKYINGDVRNQNDVETLFKNEAPFDAIFHLAGQVAMTTSIQNPRLDFETNTLGTFNILESARKYSPKSAILYSSTNKVYGDLEQYNYEETDTRYVCKEHPNGFDENVGLDFHSPYGTSKGSADQYMLDYARIYGLNTVVFRHSSMFGTRQFATENQGWIGWFVQKALEIKNNPKAEKFTICGNGKQVRDILYADDMINLYYTATENIEKVRGQAFNIGGGIENSLSLLELFKILEEKLDIKMEYIELPPRESDQRVFVADTTKIEKAIGWKVKVNKEQGIEKMIEWTKGGLT